MVDKKYLSFIAVTTVFVLASVLCGSGFTQQAQEEGPAAKKKMTASQIAFIVKFDKNEDGKLDNTEFTGSHFSVYDQNGDGFIEVHEAPEGATAY